MQKRKDSTSEMSSFSGYKLKESQQTQQPNSHCKIHAFTEGQ
jgi:hypothetical protein